MGEKIGKLSQAGMVILLDGDLGAGKTCLTQGIAIGWGSTSSVTSPTFTIQKIYHGRLLLNHIDAYRLEGIHQDLGFDEYMNDEGLTVIEWSNFSPELVPDERLTISITLLENGDRNFSFEAIGKQYEDLLEALAWLHYVWIQVIYF